MRRQILTSLSIVTVIALTVAGITSESEAIQVGTLAVLAINFLGFVVGMFITHALKFPRDGSYRYEAKLGKLKNESIPKG